MTRKQGEPILPMKLKHLQELDAQVTQAITAREQKAADEQRERAWAKASTLLKAEIAACRQASSDAITTEVHELLAPVKHVRAWEDAARLRRLVERFGSEGRGR